MQNTRLQSSRILGVAPDATLTDIKRAYRRIAKRLHPDRTGGDVAAFRRITAAYNLLLEQHRDRPQKSGFGTARKNGSTRSYTKTKTTTVPPASERTGYTHRDVGSKADSTVNFGEFKFEWSSHFARAEKQRRAKNKAASRRKSSQQASAEATQPNAGDADEWTAWRQHLDAVEQVEKDVHSSEHDNTPPDGDAEGSLGSGLFNWFKKQKRHFKTSEPSKRGEDVKLRLKTTDQTLLFGGHHRIALKRLAACPSCQGFSERPCSICRNAGRVKVREEVTVYVPPGAVSGTQIKVPGKGTAGICDFEDGDLVLIIEHELPRGFRNEGNDLIGAFRIDKQLARRGGIVQIDVPRGKVKVRVPPNTQNGDRLRLRGQGIPCPTSNQVGDVYLELSVGKLG
jgi:DnaJ-class molecular chaperone